MGIGAGTAALIAGGVGLGGSVYAANKQDEARKEAEDAANYARIQAEEEEKRIFEATKPEEEAAKITFGTGDDDELGTYNQFLTKAPNSAPTIGGGLGFGTMGGIS